MSLNAALIAELKQESASTKKILERVPTDKLDWSPHDKSMKIGRLATHIAELPIWFGRIINEKEFDFATAVFNPTIKENTAAIVALFEDNLSTAIKLLETASDETLNEIWIMRRGETVMFQLPKKVALRSIAYNHIYHHRGQLSVFLRLLDIPVPGLYGPSADERSF